MISFPTHDGQTEQLLLINTVTRVTPPRMSSRRMARGASSAEHAQAPRERPPRARVTIKVRARAEALTRNATVANLLLRRIDLGPFGALCLATAVTYNAMLKNRSSPAVSSKVETRAHDAHFFVNKKWL